MRLNFDFLPSRSDPRAAWKYTLAGLVLANILIFFLLVRPVGGTTEDLDQQLTELRRQVRLEQTNLVRMRALVKKVEKARADEEQFFQTYFMDRRTTSSTILKEIGESAKNAGLMPKEHNFLIEPVEGSDILSNMTINANYEGTYGQLVHFVNLVDRSKRFLIIDNIQANPLQTQGVLAARFKINTFVRDERKP